MYLLLICMSSLERCLFRSYVHFEIGFFVGFCCCCYVFCCWVVWVPWIFWILIPYWICGLQILSPIPYIAFLFCWWFLLLCKSFFIWCHLTGLLLLLLPLFLVSNYEGANPLFSFKSFMASRHMFKSIIHFELIFVSSVRRGLVSFFWMWLSMFPNTIFKETTLFPLHIISN